MIEQMPAAISKIINELTDRGIEVWLIGSRANPRDRPPKDWDFLVFGDERLLGELRERPLIQDLDLLVVFDGDEFESPWVRPTDGAKKTGSLSGWQWRRIGQDDATYRATKERDGDNFAVDVTTSHAIRVYAKDHAV